MDMKFGCAIIGGDGIPRHPRGLCHKVVEHVEG